MSKVHLEQGSEDWKKWRENKIGASDTPIILKESPYKTPRQLWEEKVGLANSPFNDSMRLGHELEPKIRAMVNERLGTKFEPVCYESDEYPWLACSLDGEDGDYYCEIKVNNEENHEKARKGTMAKSHEIQMNHHNIATNKKRGVYASYNHKKQDLVLVDFNPSDLWRMPILEETRKFWELVRKFESPDLLERDYEERSDEGLLLMAKELHEMQERAKLLEKEIDAKKEALVKESNASTNLRLGIYKLLKKTRKGNVDYSKIEALKDLDLEPYRKKSSSYWQLVS